MIGQCMLIQPIIINFFSKHICRKKGRYSKKTNKKNPHIHYTSDWFCNNWWSVTKNGWKILAAMHMKPRQCVYWHNCHFTPCYWAWFHKNPEKSVLIHLITSDNLMWMLQTKPYKTNPEVPKKCVCYKVFHLIHSPFFKKTTTHWLLNLLWLSDFFENKMNTK